MNETRPYTGELVRIGSDASAGASAAQPQLAPQPLHAPQPLLAPPIVAAHEPDFDYALPFSSDLPQWQRDIASISSRVRELIATMKPIAIKVIGFWDHQVRELRLGTRTLRVDAAGSYRF